MQGEPPQPRGCLGEKSCSPAGNREVQYINICMVQLRVSHCSESYQTVDFSTASRHSRKSTLDTYERNPDIQETSMKYPKASYRKGQNKSLQKCTQHNSESTCLLHTVHGHHSLPPIGQRKHFAPDKAAGVLSGPPTYI
jgi:hypothetical protein